MNLLRPSVLLILLLSLGSCAVHQPETFSQVEEENSDLSCSYFYFLWGSHAESNESYAEAFEAYEKALICDTHADYVRHKIPILLLKMGETEKAISWLQQAIKDQPDEIPLYLFLANLFIQEENGDEAISLYDTVLKLEPDNEDVLLRLALLYTRQEKYEVAEDILRDLIKRDPDHYFAHYYLARLLKKTARFKEAAVEYEQALTLNWSMDLGFELGHFYTAQSRSEDALRIYTSIIENDPYDERAMLNRIQPLLDLNRNDEALADLKRIRLSSQNKPAIDLITAKILLRKKESDKALKILTALTENRENSEPHYLLGLLFFQEKKYDSALHHLRLVKPGNELFEESVYLQTEILKKQSKPEKTITLLKKHISDPENRSPLFYALLSSLYQSQGQTAEAIALLDGATRIYSENPQIFFEYGLLLERNGMTAKAIDSMEKVLELQPDHAEALNFIGYTWAENNIHLEKALNYIDRAMELKPDNGYITDSLGWVYYRLGKLGKAEKALERAQELNPEDPHICEHLGDVYSSLGEKARAIQTYEKAYGLFKDETNRAEVRDKIESLKKHSEK
ncbi:MAG: tetratricopeptide repeat protein [Deltaproteobacteria bacterium]|nr:tetratricopeptide repeat protein [Deltaproteobacteria bacterium]